jgi:hypothetical protein
MLTVSSCAEEDAAKSIRNLAEALQELLCYGDGFGLSNRAKTILHRNYRELKKATDYYFESGENPLVWDGGAPGRPFAKKNGE